MLPKSIQRNTKLTAHHFEKNLGSYGGNCHFVMHARCDDAKCKATNCEYCENLCNQIYFMIIQKFYLLAISRLSKSCKHKHWIFDALMNVNFCEDHPQSSVVIIFYGAIIFVSKIIGSLKVLTSPHPKILKTHFLSTSREMKWNWVGWCFDIKL